MRHLSLLVLSAVLALVMLVAPVQASGVGWCKSDPVIRIDQQLADIFISAPPDAPLRVTGPTEIVVTHPVGVEVAVVATDLGFGYGERITFVASENLQVTSAGVPLQIEVYVPAVDNRMPVEVEFAPRVGNILNPVRAAGTSNRWVMLKTRA